MSKKCDLNPQAFVESCLGSLRSAGVRVTKTRLAVLEELSELDQPKTARELFELVAQGKSVKKIDQVTVYRILEKFESFGLVHRVFPSGGYLPCFHQDCGSSPHVLLRCSSCEEISEFDLPQDKLAPILKYLKRVHDFSPGPNPFQFNGVCSACEGS